MSQVVSKGKLSSAVANNGTLVIGYPAGKSSVDFDSSGHSLVVGSADVDAEDFSLTFGASNITLRNLSGISWPVGARYFLGMQEYNPAIRQDLPEEQWADRTSNPLRFDEDGRLAALPDSAASVAFQQSGIVRSLNA